MLFGNNMDLSAKEYRNKYKEFMKTDEYKKVNNMEKEMVLRMDGTMQFVFENWLKNKMKEKIVS